MEESRNKQYYGVANQANNLPNYALSTLVEYSNLPTNALIFIKCTFVFHFRNVGGQRNVIMLFVPGKAFCTVLTLLLC